MPVTDQQKLNAMRLMQSGRELGEVAHLVHLPEFVVEEIAEECEWPDEDKIRQAIFDLTREQLAKPTPKPATGTPQPVAPPEAPPTSGRPAAPSPESPAGRPDPSPIEALLAEAAESRSKRIQNLGAKIREQLGDLDARVKADRQASEELRRQIEERQKARAEVEAAEAKRLAQIADLEAQIAALKKAKGAGTPGTRTTMLSPCREGECNRNFDSLQGLNLHRKKAHGLPAIRADQVPS